jgi:nitroreductase
VPREDIEQIVHAGRLSGSAKNRQPWMFIIVTERDTLRALSECGEWCKHLAGAAFAVVMTVPVMTDPPTLTTPFDLGRAWEHGIGSVMATIYEADRARAALGIPADRAVPWAISFGYPAPDSDPRKRLPRKTGRKGFEEVARWEHWE